MKKWLMFIIIPILILSIIELLAALLFGGVFNLESGGFLSIASSFIAYFFGGAFAYELSPFSKSDDSLNSRDITFKTTSASIFALAFFGVGILIGLDESVKNFSIFDEIIKLLGMILAIFLMRTSEQEKFKNTVKE